MKFLVSTLLFLFLFSESQAISYNAAKLIYKGEIPLTNRKGESALIPVGQFSKIRIAAKPNSRTVTSARVTVSAYEAGEHIADIATFEIENKAQTLIFDVPTSHVKISAEGAGSIKVYIWGVQ